MLRFGLRQDVETFASETNRFLIGEEAKVFTPQYSGQKSTDPKLFLVELLVFSQDL